MEGRLAALENEAKNLKEDLTEVKAIALECQKLLRWGMGWAAGVGVMMGLFAPTLVRVLNEALK